MADYSTCFRPEKTKLIIQQLDKGLSLNLIGGHGFGKSRFLTDIKAMTQETHQVLICDMLSYRNNFSGFLNNLLIQLDSEVRTTRFPEIIQELSNQEKQSFLLLDNFDALTNNVEIDNGYDRNFFDILNNIKNRRNISLLCATKQNWNGNLLYIGRTLNQTSLLTLQPSTLDRPFLVHISQELDREVDQRLRNRFPDWDHLVRAIFDHRHPYKLLVYTIQYLNGGGNTANDTSDISELTEKIRKSYRDLQRISFIRKLFDYYTALMKQIKLMKHIFLKNGRP